MRRISFALLLLCATGWAAPSQAQWWGWGRPCSGYDAPWACTGGGWAPPGRVVELVPMRRPWAWGWRRWAWQREMRLRRIENWRRWVEASRQPDEVPENPPPRFRRWMRPFSPEAAMRDGASRMGARSRVSPPRPPADERPAAAAVALMPAAAARFAHPRIQTPVPAPVLRAAAAAKRPAVRPASLTPAVLPAPERRDLRPVVLRSQPAPPVAAPAAPVAPPTIPAAAEPAPASPADVPVAPLE